MTVEALTLKEALTIVRRKGVEYTIDQCDLAKILLTYRLRRIDADIDELLVIADSLDSREYREYYRIQSELENLGDERFRINSALSDIKSIIIRKRRERYKDTSQVALNHGGVYTCNHDIFVNSCTSKYKFSGLSGVTL